MFDLEDIAETFDVDVATASHWAASGKLSVRATPSGGVSVSDAEFDRFVHAWARGPLTTSCRNYGSIQLYLTLQSQAGRQG